MLSLFRSRWTFCCSQCLKLVVDQFSYILPTPSPIIKQHRDCGPLAGEEWVLEGADRASCYSWGPELHNQGPAYCMCLALQIVKQDVLDWNVCAFTCIYACGNLQSKLKVAQRTDHFLSLFSIMRLFLDKSTLLKMQIWRFVTSNHLPVCLLTCGLCALMLSENLQCLEQTSALVIFFAILFHSMYLIWENPQTIKTDRRYYPFLATCKNVRQFK